MTITQWLVSIPSWARACVLLCVALALWMSTAAAGVPGDPRSDIGQQQLGDQHESGIDYVPSQLVVKFVQGAEPAGFFDSSLVSGVARSLAHARVHLLGLTPGADLDSAAAEMNQMPSVEYAHPNYLLNPLHPVQGSFPFSDAAGTGKYSTQAAATLLRLPEAHASATGVGVTVAVIDVGVDFDHPGLAGTAVSGHDYVDGDNNAFDEPGGPHSGHGTFVAGVVHLAAPNAEVRAYRIADQEGYGDGFSLAQAIERAVDDGCRVINLSVVLMQRHLAVRDALVYAASEGVLIVAAAGNQTHAELIYPAAEAGAMAVCAVDTALRRAPFSTYGSQISVCGPGVDIYSTYQDTLFAWWSGTSFSTPFVAGTAALLAEAEPAATGALLQSVIEQSATDIDVHNPGDEGLLGSGFIDPVAALASLNGPEQATVTPDTVYFTHPFGAVYFRAPSATVWLESTNAPAAWFAEVVSTFPMFTWLTDSIGTTDDSVTIEIDPTFLPIDTFINTVLFHVDGVGEPIELTVHLAVVPSDTVYPSAWVNPNVLYFQVGSGHPLVLFGTTVLSSTHAPAAFTGEVLSGGAQVTTLLDSAGATNDSIHLFVDPRTLAVGVYEDTVSFSVDGVPAPVPLFVVLEITDSLPSDTTAIIPPSWWFVASEGSDDTIGGCTQVISSNAPAPYGVEIVSSNPVVHLFDSIGVTNDHTCFWLDPTQWPPGIYCDTLLYHISGIAQPLVQPVCLEIKPAGAAGDTGWIVPDTIYFTFHEAQQITLLPADTVWLGSTNGPAPYIAEVPLANPLFTIVADSVGMTNNWVEILVNPGAVPVGTHRNIARFHIDSVAVPVELIVAMTIIPADTSDTLETAWAIPNHLVFEAELGAEALLSGSVLLQSSNAPAAWIGEVLCCGAQVTSLVDTTGTTDDSARIVVDPARAPAVGIYVDTVSFSVAGVSGLVPVFVTLAITDSLPPDTTVGDSAWIEPTTLSAQTLAGFADTVVQYAYIFSSNAPAIYSGFVIGYPSFALLPDSVGTTNDSVRVVFDATGLGVGTYTDSIVFDVEGISDPVLLLLQLTVHAADSMAVTSVSVYPNPFNPSTTIEFGLRAGAPVELVVYNILGERVRTLRDGWLPAGTHRVSWDGRSNGGRDAASGVYFYRLRIRDAAHTGKMFLMR